MAQGKPVEPARPAAGSRSTWTPDWEWVRDITIAPFIGGIVQGVIDVAMERRRERRRLREEENQRKVEAATSEQMDRAGVGKEGGSGLAVGLGEEETARV